MKLIKKLVDWLEDLLWRQVIKDVFENPEFYLDVEDKDGADDCGTCKERADYFKEV